MEIIAASSSIFFAGQKDCVVLYDVMAASTPVLVLQHNTAEAGH